jgi:hypothetical protein
MNTTLQRNQISQEKRNGSASVIELKCLILNRRASDCMEETHIEWENLLFNGKASSAIGQPPIDWESLRLYDKASY